MYFRCNDTLGVWWESAAACGSGRCEGLERPVRHADIILWHAHTIKEGHPPARRPKRQGACSCVARLLKGGVRSMHSSVTPPTASSNGSPAEYVLKANQAIWCHLPLLVRRHSAPDSTMISILRLERGQLGCEVKWFDWEQTTFSAVTTCHFGFTSKNKSLGFVMFIMLPKVLHTLRVTLHMMNFTFVAVQFKFCPTLCQTWQARRSFLLALEILLQLTRH